MRQEREQRVFRVSVMKGTFIETKSPGRLYVSDYAVTICTIFREVTCLKYEITDISLERFGPNFQLIFEDQAGKMADFVVLLAMRVKGVVGELRGRGYPIVDRRGPLFRLPQRPLVQGIVPWREQETEEGDEPPDRQA
jgi:hypothetical protein